MSDFTVRGDSVDVQEIMEQIRARLREKRGVDYTEQQIRELAAVKLEKFLDPRAVRSDLVQQFRASRPSQLFVPFGPDPLFGARRPIIARIRRLLMPVLRLFFNPVPVMEAFTRINTLSTITVADEDQYFELLHNLVIELTRTSIEVRNLKMQVESLTSRLEFDERRARALENVVVYKPASEAAWPGGAATALPGEGPGHRIRRRRLNQGRRAPQAAASAAAEEPGPSESNEPDRKRES